MSWENIWRDNTWKVLESFLTFFPSMEKEIVSQIQEAHRVLCRINPRRNSPRHIVIKLTNWQKDEDKILKVTREKWQMTYKGTSITLSADFSTEILQARRKWLDIFKVMKGKKLQPRILYPARLYFRFDGEITDFQTSKS